MTKNKSALEDLYTDGGSFDKERVIKILKTILVIQRKEHSVFFKKEMSVKTDDKILAYALVKKLLKIEGVEEQSAVSGKEIHLKTGVPQGTVDPAIQKLKKDGFLLGSGKNYEIPTHRIETILEQLESYTRKK